MKSFLWPGNEGHQADEASGRIAQTGTAGRQYMNLRKITILIKEKWSWEIMNLIKDHHGLKNQKLISFMYFHAINDFFEDLRTRKLLKNFKKNNTLCSTGFNVGGGGGGGGIYRTPCHFLTQGFDPLTTQRVPPLALFKTSIFVWLTN